MLMTSLLACLLALLGCVAALALMCMYGQRVVLATRDVADRLGIVAGVARHRRGAVSASDRAIEWALLVSTAYDPRCVPAPTALAPEMQRVVILLQEQHGAAEVLAAALLASWGQAARLQAEMAAAGWTP